MSFVYHAVSEALLRAISITDDRPYLSLQRLWN